MGEVARPIRSDLEWSMTSTKFSISTSCGTPVPSTLLNVYPASFVPYYKVQIANFIREHALPSLSLQTSRLAGSISHYPEFSLIRAIVSLPGQDWLSGWTSAKAVGRSGDWILETQKLQGFLISEREDLENETFVNLAPCHSIIWVYWEAPSLQILQLPLGMAEVPRPRESVLE